MQNLQAPRKKSQGERVNDISDEVANNTGTKGGKEGGGRRWQECVFIASVGVTGAVIAE